MLARVLWRALRGWLPWLISLVLSSAIAYAADAGIQHAAQQPAPSPAEEFARDSSAQSRLVRLSSQTPSGSAISILCVARPFAASADELLINYAQLDEVVVDLCQAVWTS